LDKSLALALIDQMPGLRDLVSDRDTVLQMRPEELAPLLLRLVRPCIQNGIFTPEIVGQVQSGRGYNHFGYTDGPDPAIERATAEAWAWIEREGLILAAPGINGTNGFKQLSRDAEKIANDQDFSRFRELSKFPKTMLHPAIADKVYAALMRGDLDDAVLFAFRAVEEAVRAAGGYGHGRDDVGVTLMRKAFEKDRGPLRNPEQPEAEREALAHLFAGAIGSFKNSHSHRTVGLDDQKATQELVVFASHLLRIVDERPKRS
jgi:uncharacterized protein (TIGR02391 family)